MGLFGKDKAAGEAYIDRCIDSLPGVNEEQRRDVFMDGPAEVVAGFPFPCGDRCIIRPNVEGDMTPGGLYKPDIAKEKPTRGVVIAVGEELEPQPDDRFTNNPVMPSITFAPGKLKIGDEVLYGRYSGVEFEHEGETLLIVRYPDILAVFR